MCPGGAAWCRDYTYDPYGNRAATGQGVDGAVTPTAIGAFTATNNRITAANYDLAGNLTSLAVLASSMTYDANNKMTSFDGANMGFQEVGVYVYDGLGNRVRRVSTIGSSGTVNTTYVYDAFGKLAAEYSDRAPAAADVGTFYRTTDHLGSTRLVTKADGTAKRCYDFYPFGESIPSNLNGRGSEACYGRSEADSFKQKFTAKERDDESGLDYFGARYMSSALGRFTSADAPFMDQSPGDPRSWNLYSYTRNNPLKYVDSSGNYIETAWDVANVGLGVASFIDNVRQGNYGSATLDAVGVVLDSAAVVAPLVPAGAGVLIKGARAADKLDNAIDATKALNRADGAADAAGAANKGPSFLVSEGGDVIPVPSGASGPSPVVNPQGKMTGFAFTGGKGGQGLHPNVSDVRVMDPTSKQPNGYVVYQNAAKPTPQGVNPQTGRTVPHSDPSRHIPLSPKRQPGCPAGGSDCQP